MLCVIHILPFCRAEQRRGEVETKQPRKIQQKNAYSRDQQGKAGASRSGTRAVPAVPLMYSRVRVYRSFLRTRLGSRVSPQFRCTLPLPGPHFSRRRRKPKSVYFRLTLRPFPAEIIISKYLTIFQINLNIN